MLKLFLVVEIFVSCGDLFHLCLEEVWNVPGWSTCGKAGELGQEGLYLFKREKLLLNVINCHSPHSVSGTGNSVNPFNCLTDDYWLKKWRNNFLLLYPSWRCEQNIFIYSYYYWQLHCYRLRVQSRIGELPIAVPKAVIGLGGLICLTSCTDRDDLDCFRICSARRIWVIQGKQQKAPLSLPLFIRKTCPIIHHCYSCAEVESFPSCGMAALLSPVVTIEKLQSYKRRDMKERGKL